MVLRFASHLRFASALAACLAVAVATPGRSGTVVLQNDNVVDFGTVAIQSGFVAEERGAAWLTSPCNGDIIAVRILWLSVAGGALPVLGEWIRISEAGTFPTPGPVLLELLGPQMIDGGFNEFALAPTVAIAAGQTVVVDFRFLSNPTPGLGPSLVTDIDGCQAGRNGIVSIPPTAWFSAFSVGVSGDFAIRAVVACQESGIFSDGFESGDTSAWSFVQP
ncbi:MAG TPA: hypothetical protein VLA66_06435 [Thermoanaerobaculia bacterium]|nr:hypothetical protein [Thermoanaerobaculia bacterium]